VTEERVSKSMIESGGEMLCIWFVLFLSLLSHPHTPPTTAALLTPQNPLMSENRNDNDADYPLVAPRLSTLHLCPSFANDDQENHSATRYTAPIVFLSISELYTDCMGKWMDAVVGKAESPTLRREH